MKRRKKKRGLLQHFIHCFCKVVSGFLPNKNAGCYTYEVAKVVLFYEYFAATESRLEYTRFCSCPHLFQFPLFREPARMCLCVGKMRTYTCRELLQTFQLLPWASRFLAASLYYPPKKAHLTVTNCCSRGWVWWFCPEISGVLSVLGELLESFKEEPRRAAQMCKGVDVTCKCTM